jgi:hypothetical protein
MTDFLFRALSARATHWEVSMRLFLFGAGIVVLAALVDYSVTEGFYTAKFIEMSQKIGRSFVR